MNSAFQVAGRSFFLLGNIIEGEIKIGDFIDLRLIGINSEIKIEALEFALKRIDGKFYEDIGLGTNGLTEIDRKRILKICPFDIAIDIFK